MAVTIGLRNVGPTTALSVGATATTAISIAAAASNDWNGFTAFLNTGLTYVAISIAPQGTAPAAVLPVGGTAQTVIMLPASMTAPVVYSTPPGGFSMTAIGSAAGPSIIYITPVAQN